MAAGDIPDLKNRFDFHPADTPEKQTNHACVRGVVLNAAVAIEAVTPKGREQSLAITALEEAMMWANAAVARNT